MNNFESFDPNASTAPLVSYCERHEVHYMIGDGSTVEHSVDKCDSEQLATCETWRAGQIVSSCTGKGLRCTHKGIATVTVHQNDTGALEAVYAADAVENARSYAQTMADEFAEVFHIRDSGGHIIETFKPARMARALARGVGESPSESAPTSQLKPGGES